MTSWGGVVKTTYAFSEPQGPVYSHHQIWGSYGDFSAEHLRVRSLTKRHIRLNQSAISR